MTRREQIIDAIQRYKEQHGGNSPSEQELADALHISQQVVNRYIAKMVQEGIIEREKYSRRALTFPAPSDTLPASPAVRPTK